MVSRRMVIAGAGAAALAGAGVYWSGSRPDYAKVAAELRKPVKPTGAMPDLRYLVHYATLAANSHNTQPWLFSQAGDHVAIRPDLSRATPVVDANHHHVFASLGCAAENMVLAAAAAGMGASAGYVDEGDGRVELAFSGGAAEADPLFDAISKRQCTRSVYDGREVAAEDLDKLASAAQFDGSRVVLFTGDADIEKILQLVITANAMQVQDPEFRSELKRWLRFSAASAVETADGLYSGCSGNPAMPDRIGRPLFDLVFKADSESDKYAEQLRSSAGIAVFASDANDKSHWVQAGRSYQRFALQATALGIRHAFVNQPLEVAGVRPHVAPELGLGDMSPDLIVRFGYADLMPYSLRRPIDAVILET